MLLCMHQNVFSIIRTNGPNVTFHIYAHIHTHSHTHHRHTDTHTQNSLLLVSPGNIVETDSTVPELFSNINPSSLILRTLMYSPK